MKFKPVKSHGTIWGFIMGILIFGFFIWGIGFSLGPGDEILALMLYIPVYVFLGIFIILLFGSLQLEYESGEEQLVIHFGFLKVRIPWEQITSIQPIEGPVNSYSILGISWPGFIAGLYSAKGLGYIKMYSSDITSGFLLLKTNMGLYGISPENGGLIDEIVQKTNLDPETIRMDEIPAEKKGIDRRQDAFYNLLLIINVVFIAIFALYLLIFFPGSGAPSFVILLLILATALFFFNLGNAARLYQFSTTGGYVLLVVGIAVTGIFLILSLSEIHL